MRSYSTAFGVVGLLGIFVLVRRLVLSDAAALLTAALTGTSLLFVSNGSTGRMDMMSAGLGFAALACYLVLRERSFTAAVVASHCVLAMAVFSHPNALIHFAALIFLTVWLDWRKVRVQHLVLAAAPYLIGFGLWGVYIREGGVDLWRAQFAGNATAGGRDLMFADPFSAIRLEVERRYAAGVRLWARNDADAAFAGDCALVLGRWNCGSACDAIGAERSGSASAVGAGASLPRDSGGD